MLKLVLVTLCALPFLPLAASEAHGDCDSKGTPALGVIEWSDGSGNAWYFDDRNFAMGNGFWMYQETNGVYNEEDGHLQRGGSSPFVPDDDEICYDDSPDAGPDLLIF